MKRICIVMLALLVSGMSLFAQGSTEKTSKDTHLTFWTALTTTADKEVHQKLIADFQQKNPGMTISVEYVSHSDWFTRMMTAVQSGDIPDMLLCDQSEVSWMYYQDMLAPMNRVLSKIDPTGTDFVSGKSSIASCQTPDGQVWGIPFSANINCIWYRKDVLKDMGINPEDLKTWDDLYAACVKAKERGLIPMGMALARTAAYQQLFIWTNANNGNFFDENTGAYLLNNTTERKKVEEAMQFLKKLQDNGMFPEGISNWQWVDYRTGMANGEVMFTSSWGGDVGVTTSVNPAMLPNLGVIAHPSGPSADFYPPYHDGGIWAWSVTKANYDKKQEAIDKWIEFYFQPENVSLACSARPVYNLPLQRSVLSSDYFYADPVTAQFREHIEYIFNVVLPTSRRVGFEAGPSVIAGQIQSQLFSSDALQNYLFNGWSLERAIDYVDSNMKAVMKEFNYPEEGFSAKQ